jgi:hypothetical protein
MIGGFVHTNTTASSGTVASRAVASTVKASQLQSRENLVLLSYL